MSGRPSPLKSPGAIIAVKPCQPPPIPSPVPVTKPPRPLPRYMNSVPSWPRASRSWRPSPLHSVESSAVNPPQPEPICRPGLKTPAPFVS